jgi:hypothetical protein
MVGSPMPRVTPDAEVCRRAAEHGPLGSTVRFVATQTLEPARRRQLQRDFQFTPRLDIVGMLVAGNLPISSVTGEAQLF